MWVGTANNFQMEITSLQCVILQHFLHLPSQSRDPPASNNLAFQDGGVLPACILTSLGQSLLLICVGHFHQVRNNLRLCLLWLRISYPNTYISYAFFIQKCLLSKYHVLGIVLENRKTKGGHFFHHGAHCYNRVDLGCGITVEIGCGIQSAMWIMNRSL